MKCTIYSQSGKVIKTISCDDPKELHADNYISHSRFMEFRSFDEIVLATNQPFVVEKECQIADENLSHESRYIAKLLNQDGEVIEEWECKDYILLYPPQVIAIIVDENNYLELHGNILLEKFSDVSTEGNKDA